MANKKRAPSKETQDPQAPEGDAQDPTQPTQEDTLGLSEMEMEAATAPTSSTGEQTNDSETSGSGTSDMPSDPAIDAGEQAPQMDEAATPADPTQGETSLDASPASEDKAPAIALPEDDGHAPAAKGPDHASEAQDSKLPSTTNSHGPDADGVPGDGATHAGTDTTPTLISRPCDPVTGKALDGSGQPKGVVVGGSGALNNAQDKSKSFGKNNDQTMEDAANGPVEDDKE